MKSIAFRLWVGMMTLVAVVLILLWLFQIVFLNSFYTQMRISDIQNSGALIVKDINDIKAVENNLDQFSYNNNLIAELLDLSNNPIYTAGTMGSFGMNGQMGMMMNSTRTEVYDKALLGKSSSSPVKHPKFGTQLMLIGVPVSDSGKIAGVLMITLPLSPVADTVNILKQQLIYITLILIAATLLLSYLLAKSFTKPILDITNVSMEMAAGNFTSSIKTGRRDEIGRLSEAINYMGRELSKVEQLRKDLLANVSHELRTPLSLIKGYGETIRDISGENTEKREKQIGIIIEEADRLGNIVEDMLRLSQMEAGFIGLTIDEFRLNETLDRVVKKYELLSERTGVSILLKNTEDAFIEADVTKIEQVLYNLINNAFNHSPEGSVINVLALEFKDRVRIEIKDQGEGIPEDEIAYIWERFFKVDKSGKREKAGTGLGLAIVKNILNAHNAQFGVESKPGKGSTFWFELKRYIKTH